MTAPRIDRSTGSLRDPWVIPGLLALAALTVGVLLLYRGAPQSAAEVRSAAWVSVAPDAYTPRIARARERLSAALRARAAGDTAAALARYAEAEEEALSAGSRTADARQQGEAAEMWAGIALDRAELLLLAGARPWYRGDDDQRLAEAMTVVRRVQAAPVSPATKQRAATLGARVERELRTGPLEWLPR
jgi:hypothetical protein